VDRILISENSFEGGEDENLSYHQTSASQQDQGSPNIHKQLNSE
jgi:hypothetical protein